MLKEHREKALVSVGNEQGGQAGGEGIWVIWAGHLGPMDQGEDIDFYSK